MTKRSAQRRPRKPQEYQDEDKCYVTEIRFFDLGYRCDVNLSNATLPEAIRLRNWLTAYIKWATWNAGKR